jgi:isopenicillin N synthase-like dioxygenase
VSIPVFDLEQFRRASPGERVEQAGAVDAACCEFGFLIVVGHGVPEQVAVDAWAAGQAFFRLPIEQRMCVAMPDPTYPYGYAPFAGERLANSLGNETLPDLKETFSIGPVDPPPRPLAQMDDVDERAVYAQNQWPTAMPEMRDAWEAYYRANALLAASLMEVFALALGLPEHFFARFIDRHGSAMRMVRYPSLSAPPAPGQLRAGAHSDYGTLTILRVDGEPGLEIQGRDGAWTAVQAPGDGLVVNLGDLMERWTNDRWRSTMHRVVARSGGPTPERWSIPFFHNANWDAIVECLPTCLDAGEQPKHSPVSAGAHLMGKFRSTVVAVSEPNEPSRGGTRVA